MPERARRILSDSGVELSPQELLDALWLATRLPAPDEAAAAPAPEPENGTAPPEPDDPSELEAPDGEPVLPSRSPGREARPQAPARAPRRPDAGHGLHGGSLRTTSPDRDGGRPAVSVRAPEGKAVTDALALSRALRPLQQQRPSPVRTEVDEAATVDAMAETGLPDVAILPARERWLDLALVIDDGTSMLLWQRLCGELRGVLERLGAFRDVRVYGLHTRGGGRPALRSSPFGDGPANGDPAVLADPSGATMVLVVTDGIGSAWRGGRMADVLAGWGRCGPTAVLQVLPPQLWKGSGVRADRWEVTTRGRASANATWQVTASGLPPELASFRGVPIPVLAPRPASVAEWARLVASPGGTAVLPLLRTAPAAAGDLGADAAATPAPPPGTDAATAAVLRFRDTVSPEAYRLAAHLAALAPVSVPAMRLVQESVSWPAETAHLAEVFSGGLLRAVPPPAAHDVPERLRQFDFSAATKAILFDTVPTAELLETGLTVGRRMDELVGRSPDFPAWLSHPAGPDRLPDHARAFAWVNDALLVRLGIGRADAAGPRRAATVAELPVAARIASPRTTAAAAAAATPATAGRAPVPGVLPGPRVPDGGSPAPWPAAAAPAGARGEKALKAAVLDALHRDPHAHSELPAYLFLGPPGGGKTTLLRQLSARAQELDAPLAWLDLDGAYTSITDVALEAAGQFHRDTARHPALAFPAFAGLLLAFALAPTPRAGRELAESVRGVLGRFPLGDVPAAVRAGLQSSLDALGDAPPPPGVGAVMRLAGEPRLRLRHLERALAGVARRSGGSARDLLRYLRRQLAGLPAYSGTVDEVLLRALLSDLRTAYGSGSVRRRTTHCLLLLDNADCPVGEEFLQGLAHARALDSGVTPAWDPLLAVATAGTVPRQVDPEQLAGPDLRFQLTNWRLTHRQENRTADDLVVAQLGGLSLAEVTELAAETLGGTRGLPRPPVARPAAWLGRLVHDVTRGHPGAVAALLDALPRFPADTDWAYRLRRLLTPAGPLPEGTGWDFAGDLLHTLLRDVPEEVRELLPRAAAAVDLDHAFTAWGLWGDTDDRAQGALTHFRTHGLLTPPVQNGRHDQLHPLLRHLLLRELAMRPETDAFTWRHAHDALRLRARDHGQGAAAAHHALALGDLPTAAAYLARVFEQTTDRTARSEAFDLVRRAPVRDYVLFSDDSPVRRYHRLVRPLTQDDPPTAMARALAAAWLGPEPTRGTSGRPRPDAQPGHPYFDPLTDPYGILTPALTDALTALDRHYPGDWGTARATLYDGEG
ncbi:SAV_2336 N-terminal domain-related protein [Streptomyces violens]|uniref:SAV_2336 N-terminal domain-related protein n=1 Tax=Streptomyces violens TaxID=66377 RepID=UPI000691A7A6|nr:SAV_2336 N-terminal domain-related protein [Streptomyces violens]